MALINEKGVLTFKSEVETGTSKAGNSWARQTIVVSREGINEPYDKVALSVFGDKVVSVDACNIGDKVEISYSISAKEYKGRWYNDISLFKIESLAASPATRQSRSGAATPAAEPIPGINDDSLEPQEGDLPF